MPSASEGQARVYLETQACGRTLIASDIPGNAHLVRDGQTGYLCGLGDEAAFSKALIKLASDAELAHMLREVEAMTEEEVQRRLEGINSTIANK